MMPGVVHSVVVSHEMQYSFIYVFYVCMQFSVGHWWLILCYKRFCFVPFVFVGVLQQFPVFKMHFRTFEGASCIKFSGYPLTRRCVLKKEDSI